MDQITKEMDSDRRRLGTGWISGMLSLVLAAIGFSAVLCLLYPQLLTVANVRGYYNLAMVRAALHLVLIAAFVLASVSVALRQNKALGFSAMALVLVATLMGGSRASSRIQGESDHAIESSRPDSDFRIPTARSRCNT